MSKSIPEIYKTARKHLKLTQKEIAKKMEMSDGIISQVETGKNQTPNYFYTKFLIEQGINPYYLIGKSDEIEGRKADINSEEYEALKQELEDLKLVNEELKQKYQWMEGILRMLKIDPDDNNLKKEDN